MIFQIVPIHICVSKKQKIKGSEVCQYIYLYKYRKKKRDVRWESIEVTFGQLYFELICREFTIIEKQSSEKRNKIDSERERETLIPCCFKETLGD